VVELALLLPLLVILLLGAIDFAQVASAQQRLAHGAHLATLRLLTTPSLNVASYIQAASGLSPVSATTAYTRGAGGADRVVVTAAYSYPLLTPGLRNLQTRTISDGKLHITVQAAGIATTSAPTLSRSGTTVTAAAPSDATVPAGLALTCTLYQSGSQLRSGPCPQSARVVPGDVYTATVTQSNGLVSPASAPVRGTSGPHG
jgi:Flp pilus assembly protein TadG